MRNLLIGFFLLLGFQLQAADYYWVGGAGNWSDAPNHWATTSGGSVMRSQVPAATDDVYFDANSGLANGNIVTMPTAGHAYCRNMSWVGVTTAASFRNNGANYLYVYGNLELAASVTYGMRRFEFNGPGNATFKMNGAARVNQLGWYNPFNVNKAGGSLTLLDGIPASLVVDGVYLVAGDLDFGGGTHYFETFGQNNENVKNLDISNATLEMSGTWDYGGSNSTLNATGSYIKAAIFKSAGLSFPKVDITGNTNLMLIDNTTFGELTFTNLISLSGSVRIGAGNVIDRLEFKSHGLIRLGGNTINELILAPGKNNIFFGNNTINERLQLNTPECSGIGELEGRVGDGTPTLTFGPAATIDVRNVFISNMTAVHNTPIPVIGADGGGNTGWDFQPPAAGATLYWVNGAGDWHDKSHWSLTSGGAGGDCVPFSNSDVVFDANSGFTAGSNTISSGANAWCHNMTWTGVAAAPTFAPDANYKTFVSGSLTLDPTVTMNVKLEMEGPEEVDWISNGSTLGILDITINKTLPNGSVTITDDFNNPEVIIRQGNGKLLLPGRTLTFGHYLSSGGTRTTDISNATLTVMEQWTMTNGGRIWLADGSFITAHRGFNANSLIYPKVHCTTAENRISIVGATIGELVFTNPSPTSLVAVHRANVINTLEFKGAGRLLEGNNTITNLLLAPSRKYEIQGTHTVTGRFRFNSPGCEGLGELLGFNGITGTIALGPSSTTDLNNIYVRNMTATGTGIPLTFNGADAGGNTGFDITSGSGGARYWVGGSGDWNDAVNWSTTSGGPGGACVPTVDNDVFFNANSFTAGNSAVTVSQGNAYCRNMDWTGAANAPTFTKIASLTLEIWGNLVMNPGVNPNVRVAFRGPANATFTSNNSSLGTLGMDIVKPAGSSLTFLGDHNNPRSVIVLTSGGLNLSGRTITASVVTDESTAAPTNLDITNANITSKWLYAGSNKSLLASGSQVNASVFKVNGGVYNNVDVAAASSSNIGISQTTFTDLLFSNVNVASQAYIGANNTIGRLEFKGKGYIGGTGNTIGTLIFSPGKVYTFLGGSNTTITDAWYGSGTPCNLTEIASSSTTNATITKTTGTVAFDYIRLKRITAAGSTPFVAHEHSVDQGNNLNWNISPYNGSGTILGLGPDKILQSSEFPYTIHTDGFFASPLAGFAWKKDGVLLGNTSNELVVTGPGTYSVDVTYPDNCASADVIVISQAAADLMVVKTADNMTPAVGSDVVFTIAATNNGPQQSTGISITDLLGAGYTYKSAAAPAGTTYDHDTGVWTIGTLANAATTTLTITATVNTAGPYVNSATITGPEVDTEPANNSSAITPVPVPTADISITKTVDQSSPHVGSNVVFTLNVSNAGPSDATGIVVTDLLPDGYTYVSAVVPAGNTYNPLTGLWTIGSLANGADITATITATVNVTGTYANTASVILTENDPQAANNTSTVTPVPTPLADLSIVKTINNPRPYAGANVLFILTAANAGPSTATGVMVTDLLPSGYTFVSATPSQGTYNPSGTWAVGTLANGANATLRITATVKDAGVFANTATITGTETDPVTTNNFSTVLPTPVIIKMIKTGPSTVNAGALVQYVLSVKNTGTGDGMFLTITDPVSPELTNVSWTAVKQGAASISSGATGTGNNVTVRSIIPAGAANYVDIFVSGTIPAASAATSISNTARMTAPGSPVVNSNTVITAIGKEVDLHVQKAGPATVVAGSTVVYTLNVTNTGPSDASGVTIADNIPAGLNNVTWTAAAQNGAVINGALSGTGNVNLLGFIPAGMASISVTITGTLDANYAGATLVNTATATPAAGVTDLTPASSTITSTVVRRANVRIVKSGPANIGAGEPISYVLRVVNDGPSDVSGVEIEDIIPAQVLNLTRTWTATVKSGAALSTLSGLGDIALIGNIPAGSGVIEILVSGTVDPSLSDGSTFSNTATANLPAGSPVTDPDLASNTSTISTVVSNTPDLRVSKNGPSTVNIGDPITYTIVIANGGVSNITNAQILDEVPASVTVTSWKIEAAGSAAVTAASSGTTNLIESMGDIPAGLANNLTLTVQGTVNVTALPTFTNTVTVIANGTTSSSVVTAVNQSTDIVVEKNGPQAVIAGRPISYTVKLSNAGPQNAQGLILSDVIPAAIENVTWSAVATGAASINGTSTGTTNTIFVNADVNAGAGNYILITVNGTVASSTLPSTITNIASVTLPAALTDFDLANNTSVVNTVVSRETNLAITKAVDNVAPDAGSNVVFTLVATNNGPSDATGVQVVDALPAGYTYVSSNAPAGTTYSSATGEWNIGTLANTASSTLTITATVNAAGAYANTATISGTESDPIIANNTATVTPVPVPVTDLAITKTADNLVPGAGSNIVFTLVASNNGPSAATGVNVTDLLPAGYTYVSSTPPTGTTYNPATGLWTIGSLANGASSTLTITATVNAAGPYANTATISGTENDPAAGNNTATATPVPTPVTDLVITKTADNLSPNAGGNVVFTIVATNNGPSGATGVSATDLLPSGYTYISSTAPGTSYTPATGLWTIGTLANAASSMLTITARINAAGTYANIATISGIEADPAAANNSATATPVPVPVTDLMITKTADDLTPDAGSNIVFTLRAANNGPSGATSVAVTDLLPAGYAYVSSVAPTGTTYTPATGVWAIGTLANAASSTLTITARVNASGPYVNTAIISGTETDPSAANNTVTVTPVPVPVTDLAVVKTVDNANPVIGSNVVFSIVATNNGPSNGTGISITDLLPSAYTYVSSATAAGTTYDPATGLWTIGSLANGATATLTITTTVNAAGLYANSAIISGMEIDPVSANNASTVTPVPVPVTDLAITKTADKISVAVGSDIVFTMVATNNGPSEGTGIAVTDLLPAGYTYVSSAAEAGTSYDPLTGVWTIGTLANAASSTLTVTATVNVSGDYSNTAVISGMEGDPVAANNTATIAPVVDPVTDLSVIASANNMGPNAGSNIVFTLVATNNGPSGATGVALTDLLPAGYTYVSSAAPAGTTYTSATGVWAIGTLANASSSTLTITARVNAAGPYVNTATISGTESDPDLVNNTATVTPVPVPVTDLMITKTADNLIPATGSNIVFTLVATNNGPSGATGVAVTDLLPAGYTYVSSVAPAGTTYTPATGVWAIGTMANAGSSTLTITARVNAAGPYVNAATISGTENDPVSANNTVTVTLVPVPVTDLVITKTADDLTPDAGSNIVFTLVATNNGPSGATGVAVTDLLPAGYTYVSSAAPAGTTYTPATGVWAIGTLVNAASSTLTITATVNAAGPYVNTATISGTENDSVFANNTATVTPVPVPVTDLMITKTADDLTPDAGGNIVFTLVAANNGPSGATGVVLTDLLPAGYTYVSSTAPAGTTYAPATGVWTIGSLANAGSSTLTITATVNAAGPYANTATITGTENDLVSANNTATVTPVPVPVTDLMITKTADNLTPDAGSNIVFTLVATNNGPSGATGVAVTDLLPADYTYISSNAPAGTTYTSATGVWTIGTLANAASSTLTITATVNAAGPYVNTATISGTENDPDLANNTATVTPVPVPVTDLMITKTADKLTPDAGSNIVFTLVAINNGPSGATGIAVTDLLPAGYNYVSSAAPAGTTYTSATGVWAIGTLANAASSTLTITATVNAAGPYVNTATISGTESDPDLANNTATVSPIPVALADLNTVKALKNPAQTSFVPGQGVVYTIRITNNGPSDAFLVNIRDVAPAGTTISSWTAVPSGGVVYPNASGSGNLNESLPVLGNGMLAVYEVTVMTPRNFTGTLSNSVQVSSATPDPVPGCTTCTTAPISALPGEFVTWKTVATASGAVKANAAEELIYTIHVRNTGLVLLTALTITDPVPANTSYVSGGTLNGNTVMLSMSSLAPGATATERFRVRVNDNLTGVTAISNTASVSDGVTAKQTGACDPADPGCSLQPGTVIDIAGNPLLGISKSASEAVYQNDGSYVVSYTMNLVNMGDVPLTSVQVPDDLKAVFPAPVEFSLDGSVQTTGQLIANGSYNGVSSINLLAAGSSLSAGQEATITFQVRIRPNRFFGPFSNQVTATAMANGLALTARSSNGLNPDLNKDGIPDAASATPLELKLIPLKVPNVFTPNGDDRNETFVVKNLELHPDNELTIVNRWGNTVFERKGYRNDWAATGLNEGTYFYVLKVKRESDKWEIYKGYITLLRNK